jgi:hypothetical protein
MFILFSIPGLITKFALLGWRERLAWREVFDSGFVSADGVFFPLCFLFVLIHSRYFISGQSSSFALVRKSPVAEDLLNHYLPLLCYFSLFFSESFSSCHHLVSAAIERRRAFLPISWDCWPPLVPPGAFFTRVACWPRKAFGSDGFNYYGVCVISFCSLECEYIFASHEAMG